MDQRPNVSMNNVSKPSKLLAIIALAIAFALPFILVKTFPHKVKPPVSKGTTLSELEEEEKDIPDEEEIPANDENQDDSEEAEETETIPAPSSVVENPSLISKRLKSWQKSKNLK